MKENILENHLKTLFVRKSDVNPFSAETGFRRQNWTSEDGPRTERIKKILMDLSIHVGIQLS